MCLYFALLAAMLAGCSSLKQADTARFYTLSPASAPDAGESSLGFSGLLFVAPVELATYLENPGIVVRRGDSQIEFTERQQWAQPLGDNVTQVLREDLASLLGIEHVHPSQHQRPRGPFVSLQVRMDQFEFIEQKQAVLAAVWQLRDGDSGKLMGTHTTRIEKLVPATGTDFDGRVVILSKMVAELSQEIAAALQSQTAREN